MGVLTISYPASERDHWTYLTVILLSVSALNVHFSLPFGGTSRHGEAMTVAGLELSYTAKRIKLVIAV